MKLIYSLCAILGLTACAPSPQNDPIYQALLANPPTTIPSEILPRLRSGDDVCTVFNQDQRNQYMTCWWVRGEPPQQAYLAYFPPNLFSPPEPFGIPVHSGTTVSQSLLLK